MGQHMSKLGDHSIDILGYSLWTTLWREMGDTPKMVISRSYGIDGEFVADENCER